MYTAWSRAKNGPRDANMYTHTHTNTHTQTHTLKHTHTHTQGEREKGMEYMYVCVCVCICDKSACLHTLLSIGVLVQPDHFVYHIL